MSIHIAFDGKAPACERQKAVVNLCRLLMELALPYIVLLDWMGVEIQVQCQHITQYWLPLLHQPIAFELECLQQFTYRRHKITTAQHLALVTLKRAVIARLDIYCRFTSRPHWRKAAHAEWGHHASPSPNNQVTLGRRFIDKVREWTGLSPNAHTRLLTDIIIMRDELGPKLHGTGSQEQRMLEAFPHTYPLVHEFDATVQRAAEKISVRAFPELAAHPTDALFAMRRRVQITWSEDTSSPDVDHFRSRRDWRPRSRGR